MPTEKIDFNMLREIEEQPGVFRRLIERYVAGGQIEMPEFDLFEEKLKNAKRFSFWGIGSSYHAAIYGNYLFEESCRVPCEAESADELVARHDVLESDTTVVALSQSGETTDLITAIKRAKMEKILTIGIINNEDSTLGSLVDVALYVRAGEEKAIATTKVFNAQLFVLLLLAAYLNQLKGRDNSQLLTAVNNLPEKIAEVIRGKTLIAASAKKYLAADTLMVLGRHWHYPIALETALKLKETAYLPAEGMVAESFRHGPEAVIDKSFAAICYILKDRNYMENLAVLDEITKAGGQALALVNERIESAKDQVIIPQALEVIQPIISVVVGQYLAYYLALERGLDIDHPRNIFKFIRK